MKKPKITAIIPTYKRPFLLKRAIKSVLNQTFYDLQVCVYDNASGDETKDIVDEIASRDKRVKYFAHEINIGGPQNFRYGLMQNESEYFSFLSDDDLLFPNFYELGIQNLKKYPDAAFFAGNFYTASLNNIIISPGIKFKKEGYYSRDESINTFFLHRPFVPWTSMLFNYSHVKHIELSNCAINDVDYVLKIMLNLPVVVASEVCAVYYINNSGLASKLTINDFCSNMLDIEQNMKQISSLDPKIITEVSGRIRQSIINFLFQKGKESIKNKNRNTFDEVQKILGEFKEEQLIIKLNFLLKLREISFLWYSLSMLRRSIFLLRKKITFLSKKCFFSEKKKFKKLLSSLGDR